MEREIGDRSSNSGPVCYVHFRTNTLGKDINQCLSAARIYLAGLTGLSRFQMATSLGKEKTLYSKSAKVDMVSFSLSNPSRITVGVVAVYL